MKERYTPGYRRPTGPPQFRPDVIAQARRDEVARRALYARTGTATRSTGVSSGLKTGSAGPHTKGADE